MRTSLSSNNFCKLYCALFTDCFWRYGNSQWNKNGVFADVWHCMCCVRTMECLRIGRSAYCTGSTHLKPTTSSKNMMIRTSTSRFTVWILTNMKSGTTVRRKALSKIVVYGLSSKGLAVLARGGVVTRNQRIALCELFFNFSQMSIPLKILVSIN